MKEEVIEILEEIRPDLDFNTEEHLVSGKVLESIDIIELISELSDHFNVSIGPKQLINENFDSADAIARLVMSLM